MYAKKPLSETFLTRVKKRSFSFLVLLLLENILKWATAAAITYWTYAYQKLKLHESFVSSTMVKRPLFVFVSKRYETTNIDSARGLNSIGRVV